MRDPCVGRREVGDVVRREMDAVRAPDVRPEPTEIGEVLDRRAAIELEAVRLLLARLREVGVQRKPELPGELRGLGHQGLRHRERRARRDCDLDARVRAVLVQLGDEAFRVRENGVDVLHELVRRQAAVGHAEVHRATRRDDANAQLAGGLHLRLDQAGAAAREDVVVVEDRRASGERELREPGPGGGVLGFGVDPGPHRIELPQPAEQVGFLCPRASQRLVQVVVGVDEARA